MTERANKPTEAGARRDLRRRGFLAAAAAAASTSLAGCPDPLPDAAEPTPTETAAGPRPAEPDREIDVTRAGADPSGETAVDDVLADVAADDTRLVFPEGRYRLGTFHGEFRNLQLHGEGAVLVPGGPAADAEMIDLRGPGNVIEGFTVDYRGAAPPPSISVSGPDGWLVRDCTFRGVQAADSGEQHGEFALLPTVTAEGGTGTIANVYMHEGSGPLGGSGTRGGIWFGPDSVGRVHVDRIWMERWANNTIYCHNTPGAVRIENSFFRNTNVAGTRVGGNTILRNNTYLKTARPPRQSHRPAGQGRMMRGVWITGGGREYGSAGSVLIEGCDFGFLDPRAAGPAISQPYDIDGELVVRNCRIRQSARQAIRVDAPTEVVLEDVNVSGETELPAVGISPDATVDGISGRVATRGPVSNRSDVARALADGTPTSFDPSPPDGLSRPDGSEPIPTTD